MKTIFALCVLLVGAFASPVDDVVNWSEVQPSEILPEGIENIVDYEDDSELLPSPRIVGGNVAVPNSFTYQVGLLITVPQGQTWCGGSIISKQYILTAAHCVDGARAVTVYLGAHDILNARERGQVRINVTPSSFIIHQGWNPNTVRNDIALIKLVQPIVYNDKIQPINLPRRSQASLSFEGYTTTASGWGRYTDTKEDVSSVLRFVDLAVMSQRMCNQRFQNLIQPSNICTNGANRKSTCNGDSGGPLVVREQDGTRTLIGLTSFGSSYGCEKGWPAVFTRVSYYLDWISQRTGVQIRA